MIDDAVSVKPLVELKPGSFIFTQENALSPHWCEEIIRRFESSVDEQYPGRIGQVAKTDQSIKRSTDLVVSGKSHWKDVDRCLFRSLGTAVIQFRERYPYFKGSFKDMGYGIQKTEPGEYYHWHIDSGSHEFAQRQLVAIWYLNDVSGEGGCTEFLHQAVSVEPRQGRLLLFPPFWTHEHRGVTVTDGVKYIATTWIVFA